METYNIYWHQTGGNNCAVVGQGLSKETAMELTAELNQKSKDDDPAYHGNGFYTNDVQD